MLEPHFIMYSPENIDPDGMSRNGQPKTFGVEAKENYIKYFLVIYRERSRSWVNDKLKGFNEKETK